TPVLLQTQDKQSRDFFRQTLKDFDAVVGRAVIYNNEFSIGGRLCVYRANGCADDGTVIEIWNHCRKARWCAAHNLQTPVCSVRASCRIVISRAALCCV